jgi:hypothetical protein
MMLQAIRTVPAGPRIGHELYRALAIGALKSTSYALTKPHREAG